jgi:hypothetical protein
LSLDQCKKKGRHKFDSELVSLCGDSLNGFSECVEYDNFANALADDVVLIVEKLYYLIVKVYGHFFFQLC